MKKIIGFIIVILMLFQNIALAYFNPQNVYNFIKELSSEKYRGRLCGDIGNELACDFVVEKFKDAKLKPLGDNNTFFQHFYAYVPYIEGETYFRIYDNNKLIKEYKYGIDFKEVPFGLSKGGYVKGKIYSDKKKGNIFISINYPSETVSEYDFDKDLLSKGIKAVIYMYNLNPNFKSTYKLQNEYSKGLIKIALNSKYLDEIINFQKKGYTFEIKSSIKLKKVKTKNIVALKKAKEKKYPPIIFSAHIDHVGFDSNKIYPGALDNASGVSFLIELANHLKNKQTNRDIIFIAFNAEEEGLLGSYYFVNNPPISLEGAECINFDMIGSKKEIPLTALKSSLCLNRQDSIDAFLNSYNLKRSYEDSSDHVPFTLKGISSVTLIHDDLDKIHTPYDTIENIDIKNIIKVYKIVEDYLNKKNVFIEDKNMHLYYVISITFITIIVFIISFYRKFYNKK